mgnify:FL=1
MKVPNGWVAKRGVFISLSRLQNEGSQQEEIEAFAALKSIKATE